MKLVNLIEKLNLSIINAANLNVDVCGAYASDLLSDVMGNAKENQIWITLQTHQNVGAIASLKDMAAVILVNNLKPNHELLNYAVQNEINILSTKESTFNICGLIYKELFK
jgi:serine kinase of HPr protein (carbohydrate metabolism regulator)